MFHKNISEERINLEIASHLQTSVQSFSSGEETKVTIQTAGAKIENSCLGIKILGTSSLDMNIYSARELNPKLGQLFLFTKKLEYPFYITNLVMLVEPETKFIFVNNSDPQVQELIEDLEDELPAGLKIEEIDGSKVNGLKAAVLEAGGYSSKVEIISFIRPTHDILVQHLDNNDITLVYVQPDFSLGVDSSIGNLTYYTPINHHLKMQAKSFYLGLSTLTAASVSDGKIYNCNFKKIMTKLHYSLNIYQIRYKLLISHSVSLDPSCLDALSSAVNLLHDTDTLVETLRTKPVDKIKSDEIKELANDLNRINGLNDALIYKSCPQMY